MVESEGSQEPDLGGLTVFTIEDLVAVRLLQLYVFRCDLLADANNGTDSVAPGQPGGKTHQWDRAVAEGVQWAKSLRDKPSDGLDALERLLASEARPEDILGAILAQRSRLTPGSTIPVTLEAFIDLKWADEVKWSYGQPTMAMRSAGAALDESVNVDSIRWMHGKVVKRIRKDAVPVGVQMATLGVSVAGALLAPGASQAIGTAVGTHLMGLSGAAATSAGLAWLGGGSLASGGLGMAGGMLLLGIGTHSVTMGTRQLIGLTVAEQSPIIFASELAKLDVHTHFDPRERAELITSLRDLKAQLKSKVEEVGATTGEVDRASTSRNLAWSLRMLDCEIDHLTATDSERLVAKATRLMGIPAISKAFRPH